MTANEATALIDRHDPRRLGIIMSLKNIQKNICQ